MAVDEAPRGEMKGKLLEMWNCLNGGLGSLRERKCEKVDWEGKVECGKWKIRVVECGKSGLEV